MNAPRKIAPLRTSVVQARVSPVQSRNEASGHAIGPSSRVRWSPRTTSFHASASAREPTTAYSATSRLASSDPSFTGIRTGTHASVANASSHG